MVAIDCLFEGIDFQSTITRARFEKLNMDLFRNCIDTVKKCLTDVKLEKHDVHDVVLVGGSTRIPKVQQLLQEFFGGKELCKSINPDEAVAYGAAVHAAVLSGVVKSNNNIVLVDVTPLSLGVEGVNGDMSVILRRNTTIPSKANKSYVTTHDNQTTATFQVYEGERPIAKENNFLSKFSIYGLPLAPKGVINFDVCFEIDLDGILKVSAMETKTGKSNQIVILNHCGRLQKDEIDRMVQEAERFKTQDEEFRKRVKAKNALESYANNLWEVMNDYGNGKRKIGANLKKLKNAVEKTLQWLEDYSDVAETSVFENKLEELESLRRRFAPKLHPGEC